MKFKNKDTQILFDKAFELAEERSRRHVCEDILCAAFFPCNNLSSALILTKLGLDEQFLIDVTCDVIDELKPHKQYKKALSPSVKEIIRNAEILSESEEEDLAPYHILAAFSANMPRALSCIEAPDLIQAYFDFVSDAESEEDVVSKEFNEFLPMFEISPVIGQFAENLNIKASEGEFSHIVDYDKKVDEMITILCKKQKPNPILVGNAGCGKTSLAQALAHRIVNHKVPDMLSNTVIYSLSLSSMVAGTEYRGQFEQRIQNLVKELKKYNNLVIFIDEIHTLVGAGNTADNSLDASNILKPDLASGAIRCIGATTIKEYNNTIKKDSALDRRFERVLVREPSTKQMESILPTILSHYESNHNIKYGEDFIEGLLPFCDKFLPNKSYPDKAVDVIDFCGAKCKVKFFNFSDKIGALQEEISPEDLNQQSILDFYQKVLEEVSEEVQQNTPTVTKEHLREYFDKFKNPIYTLHSDKDKRNMLRKGMVGQNKAFDKFMDGIASHMYGPNAVEAKNKPNAFLFFGPEGSGKTVFCDALSKCLISDGANVIRYSGIELSDYYSKNKILNDTRDESSLSGQVILNPTSVIIIDGIEDCNESVINLFKEILSKGKLNFGYGEVADFANCLIIFTSDSKKSDSELGFNTKKDKKNIKPLQDFKPFCLEIELEKPNKKILRRIVYNHVVALNKILSDNGLHIKYTFKSLNTIADKALQADKDFIHKVFNEDLPRLISEEKFKGNENIDLSKIRI